MPVTIFEMAKAINTPPPPPENQPVIEQPETINCVYTRTTPCHFNIGDQEIYLHNKQAYELPVCEYVQSLIAQGYLVVKK